MSVKFIGVPLPVDRLGIWISVGCTALLITSGVSLRSLIWPEVTTVSPGLTPLSTAIWSPRVDPVVTNV